MPNSKIDVLGIYVVLLLSFMCTIGVLINSLVFFTIIEGRQFYCAQFMLLFLLAISDLVKSLVIVPMYIYISKFNLANFCHSLVITDNIVNTITVYIILMLVLNEQIQKSCPCNIERYQIKLGLGLSFICIFLANIYNIGLSVYFDKVLNKKNELCLPVNDFLYVLALCIGIYILPLVICVGLICISHQYDKEEIIESKYITKSSATSSLPSNFEVSKKSIKETTSSSTPEPLDYYRNHVPSQIFVLKPSFYSTFVSQTRKTSTQGQNSNNGVTFRESSVPEQFNQVKYSSNILHSISKTGRFLIDKISSSVYEVRSHPTHSTIIFIIISAPYYILYICRPYWLSLQIDEAVFIWLKIFSLLNMILNPLTFSLSNKVIVSEAKNNLRKIFRFFKC